MSSASTFLLSIGLLMSLLGVADGEAPATRASPAATSPAQIPSTDRSALLTLTAKSEQKSTKRANLRVLAIGVSLYQQRELSLKFAAKDARDFAKQMRSQEGGLYREVSIRILTDADATRDHILDGLEWLQRQTSNSDVAILFLAGHGETNPGNSIYYFLPYDADPNATNRTMISQSQFRDTLRAISGKAVVFIDSCHAGQIYGNSQTRGSNSQDAFRDELDKAENGIVVFAASTGRQLSIESKDWGNGVFTYALLEALRGRADREHSGRVTITMLDSYISARVRQLTKGQQTPTSAKPTNVPDFPVSLVRELTNDDVEPLY